MPEEVFQLRARGSAGAEAAVRLEVRSEHPAVIVASWDDSPREYSGVDLFACLLMLRTALEAQGLLLCCQGARRHVSPSGMTRQMSNGRLAYVIQPGRQVSDDDLVEVFQPADCSAVASIADQKDATRRIFHQRP